VLDPWNLEYFEATTPQYPGLSSRSPDMADAAAELMRQVFYAQPLAEAVIDALRNAGHTADVIAAWDKETRLIPDRDYRNVAETALSTLDSYTNAGVPALTACAMFAFLDPVQAGQVHAAGCTPHDVRAYAEMSESQKWYQDEFDILPWLFAGLPFERGERYVDHCTVEEAIAWEGVAARHEIPDGDLHWVLRLGLTREAVTSGFPVQRAAFYFRNGVSGESAVAWERVLSEFDVDDSDLRDILRARFEPDRLRERAEPGVDGVRGLAEAARMLLALTAPHLSTDLWRDEPPF
jgi:hypothetical protein